MNSRRSSHYLLNSGLTAVIHKVFVVLVLSAAAISATAANIVSNPGFESGMTGWITNPSHQWVATSQNVSFGSLDAANGSGTGDCGGVNSCLNPASGAYMYQDLSTTIGQDYTVDFEYFFSGSSGLQELDAYFGGTEIANISVTSNIPSWISFSTDIVATTTTTRLEFVEGNDPAVTYLDQVSVSSAPEPSTWATFAGGVTLLLLALKTSRVRPPLCRTDPLALD
jgi:hypothetical protein